MISVKRKLFKGAVWNAVSGFGSHGINFITIIVLARMLKPEDFGIYGMAAVIVAFFGHFSEWGLTSSLIQKKEIDDTDCNSVYWGMTFFAIFSYLLIFFTAPFFALFYNDSRITLFLRVIFISFLIEPLSFIPYALEVKKINYHRLAVCEMASSFLAGAFAICFAALNFGAWSLVAQQVIGVLLYTVAIILMTGWRPKAIFSVSKFRGLMSTGVQFTIKHLMVYFSKGIGPVLVGKLSGASPLGLYSMAFRIATYPSKKFEGIFGEMILPAFVSFQEDAERIKRNFLRVSVGSAALLLPVFIYAFFGIEQLIMIILGDKWLGAVPIARVAIIYMVFESLFVSDEPLMIVFGKLKEINIIRALTSAALLVAGYFFTLKFGIIGMAAVFAVTSIVYILIIKLMLLHNMKIGILCYLRHFNKIFGVSIMLMAIVGMYYYMANGNISALSFLLVEAIIVFLIVFIFMMKNGMIWLDGRNIRMGDPEELYQNMKGRMNKKQIIEQLKSDVFCRLKKSEIQGVGVFAIRDIPKGTNPFFGCNTPRSISFTKEELAGIHPNILSFMRDVFVYSDETQWVPDIGLQRIDLSYFVNHSDSPNLYAENGGRVFITLRDIIEGEELTVDYKTYSDRKDNNFNL